jgi:SAM-dependent methyltransferase
VHSKELQHERSLFVGERSFGHRLRPGDRNSRLVGAHVLSGRRPGQRFDAEFGVTTEALIFLGQLDPEALGPSQEFATHYEATPVNEAQQLLDGLPLEPERTTFVDIGSGMGRVVLLAAMRPYRQVIGVELSPALHQIAHENHARFPTAHLRCRDVRFVRADALRFTFPRGDLAVYLYNPFGAAVVRPVIERLVAHCSGVVTIAYHTPVERAVLDEHPALACIAEFPFGAIWSLRPGVCV